MIQNFIKSKIEGRDNVKKILTNISWLFFDKVFKTLLGVVLLAWIARYLGPASFGKLNYAIAFTALFAFVATLGLDNVVIKEIIKYQSDNKRNTILGSAFGLRLVGGLLALILSIAVIYLIRPYDLETVILVSILSSMYLFQSLDTIDYWFQSQTQAKYTVIAKNIAFLITAIAKIAFILSKASLIYFALATSLELSLGSLFLLVAYKKVNFPISNWKFNLAEAKRLLKESWPLMFSSLSIMIYMKISQVMLGEMIDDKAVGIYSSAVRLSEIWYFIPMIVGMSIYPTLVHYHQTSREKFEHKLKMVMGAFFWGALALSLVLCLFSRQIITLFYGVAYIQAAPVLSIHIFASIFVCMGVIYSQKFIVDGKLKINLFGAVAGAVSNVLLNLWLIRDYGIIGAAVSTPISYFIPVLLQSMFFDKRIGLTYLESIVYVFRGVKIYGKRK